ncbi:11549_t:CDS:10 [Acaulospora morrowiae]|uniref:11549_t:CDS:1 n=1 Tax=Acaulospora morrowiae TaxID=94023 RepID=A0A9N8V4P3_9GLOM|nr:11549_t:CDS:10 [Acaulospora morrowiae]
MTHGFSALFSNLQNFGPSICICGIVRSPYVKDKIDPRSLTKMVSWKAEEQILPKPETIIPEENANILSLITFWWVSDLLKLGYKRPLQKDDLYVMSSARQAKIITDKFEQEWKNELKKQVSANKFTLIKALNRVIGFRLWTTGGARFMSDLLLVLSPLIIRAILVFAINSYYASSNNTIPPPSSVGYILVTILFLTTMFATLFNHWAIYGCMEAGLLTRTILITAIYRKTLVLSGKARNIFTTGKITNIMSTDTTRVDNCLVYFHLLWAAPLQLSIALLLLILNIGPAALAGFLLLIIAGPLQGKVMASLVNTRRDAQKVTDERVKLTQELLQGIRVIKYYAWEDSFLENLNKLRSKEIGLVKHLLLIRAIILGISSVIPVFASILSFIVFVLAGGNLTADIVFTSLALFNVVRFPLKTLPMVIGFTSDAWVAVGRIQELLLAEELDFLPEVDTGSDFAIKVIDGEFMWEGTSSLEQPKNLKVDETTKENLNDEKNTPAVEESIDDNTSSTVSLIPVQMTDELKHVNAPRSQLRNINLSIPRGKLVAIVGSVGSGKSSLLSALVGEMKKVHGEVVFGGNVGYCPQSAWIQNATLRENVTFGLPFHEERYNQVIKDCCLEPDLGILPAGDMTEIGEKGINLSGGQKQRVNIARAVYFDADIVLLDDPLSASAVDSHVGGYLFTNCIQKTLANKTRLLVTHHLQVLSRVDYIIFMDEGKISGQGTYEQLMKENERFSKLIKEFGEDERNEESKMILDLNAESTKTKVNLSGFLPTKELMQQEERVTGAVENSVYLTYIRSAGGIILIPILLFLLIMMQGSNIGNNLWLSYWTNDQFGLTTNLYMIIYCAWGASEGFFSILVALSFSLSGLVAAKDLHAKVVKRVLRAPIKLFDTTPLGRIINRFSRDVDTCDNLLPESYRMFFTTAALVFGTFFLIIVIYQWFFIPFVPLITLYYFSSIYFRATNRELRRIDSILRSSLYAHFSETLTGLSTIRAYREQKRFTEINEHFMDLENRAYYLTIAIQRWLGIRLETIANVLMYCAGLLSVIERFQVLPTITGLILSYATQVNVNFNYCIRQTAEVEANMNAVERLIYYANSLEMEAEPIIEQNRPPPEWPFKGDIEIIDLVIKYGPEMPPVLKGVSIHIKASEKIGIVGRTGCGKSTLATSFFRLVEPTSGQIMIDDIDITTIGLRDLRSRITIIPQDPVLFNGTLRSNLDPFNEHDDLTLWNALRRAHLINGNGEAKNHLSLHTQEKVPELSMNTNRYEGFNLDSPVIEHGNNFSQGQQQLIALSRALVRNSKLIIMDEATASVDFRTDSLIQKTIREEFTDSTVITIAHRLRTIADYDRILVMDAGKVVEFDSPSKLIREPKSMFRGMCESSGDLDELERLTKQKFGTR